MLMSLPLMLGILPLTVLAAFLLPQRMLPAVLASGGMLYAFFSGGWRGFLLLLLLNLSGLLILRFQPDGKADPKRARFWFFVGAGIQAALLLAGKPLVPGTLLLLPHVLCGMQTVLCLSRRMHGGAPAPAPFSFLSYQYTLPRLMAGPVCTPAQLREAAGACSRSLENAEHGALRITAGLFRTVLLAGPLSTMHRQILETRAVSSVLDAWTALLVCYCTVYYAVYGLSDIGRGIALLLGYSVPKQFDAPVRARTLHDFSTRWLSSAAAWCREVLLRDGLPLDHGAYFARVLLILCGMGLLLGNGFTGLLWGAEFALMLTLERMLLRRGVHLPELPARALTACCVLLSTTFLHADSVTGALSCIGSLLGRGGFALTGTMRYLLGVHWLPLMLAVIGLFPLRDALIKRTPELFRRILRAAAPVGVLAVLLLCMTELFSRALR